MIFRGGRAGRAHTIPGSLLNWPKSLPLLFPVSATPGPEPGVRLRASRRTFTRKASAHILKTSSRLIAESTSRCATLNNLVPSRSRLKLTAGNVQGKAPACRAYGQCGPEPLNDHVHIR